MDDTSNGGGCHGDSEDIKPVNADDKINMIIEPVAKRTKVADDFKNDDKNKKEKEIKEKENANEKEEDVRKGEAENVNEIHVINLVNEEVEVYFHFECSNKKRLQKRKNASASRSNPVVAERQIDAEFSLPSDSQNITRKIKINVELFDPVPCTIRPSFDLPLPGCPTADSLTEPNDLYIIINRPDTDDFVNIWKITGSIYFQPDPNWTEATARVRLYYFLGTSNTQSWSHSDFITAPFEADKETRVDFVLSLNKNTYARVGKNENSWTSSSNPLFTESAHFVAFIGTDGFMKRSKEFALRFSQKAVLKQHQQLDGEPITIDSD